MLDKNIEDCSIIIPNMAFRDEGTSYHYLPDSESIELNRDFKDLFEEILKENNYEFLKSRIIDRVESTELEEVMDGLKLKKIIIVLLKGQLGLLMAFSERLERK